jgi:hypothetical protein
VVKDTKIIVVYVLINHNILIIQNNIENYDILYFVRIAIEELIYLNIYVSLTTLGSFNNFFILLKYFKMEQIIIIFSNVRTLLKITNGF